MSKLGGIKILENQKWPDVTYLMSLSPFWTSVFGQHFGDETVTCFLIKRPFNIYKPCLIKQLSNLLLIVTDKHRTESNFQFTVNNIIFEDIERSIGPALFYAFVGCDGQFGSYKSNNSVWTCLNVGWINADY